MCHAATPGMDTVGYPFLPARTAYSASSHLMNSGTARPISLMIFVGIRHIHQPLYSESARRCSQGVLRRFRRPKSCLALVFGAGPHHHLCGSTASAYACSSDLSCMLNI